MLFIMGFASLIVAVCKLWPNGGDCWLAAQMQHASWDGLTHHDTIFPLFLFISGMTFPFSLAKRREKGISNGKTVLKVLLRGLVLVLLGIVYNGLFKWELSSLRFYSVLGRIGLAWMIAALLYIFLSWKPRVVITVLILVGYNLLLLIPAGDYPWAGSLSLMGNIVGYVDRGIMPGHLLYYPGFDPEGLLSTIPAVATAMLGQFAGEFVRSGRFRRKTLTMLVAAAVLLALGLIWSLWFPINKKLWSSSFTLVVAAYSLAMFAIFYYLIDVKGWKKWAFPLEVIGLNSLTIYLAQRIISVSFTNRFFLEGLVNRVSAPVGQLIYAVGYVTLCWLLLYFLYRKKVFLKI